MAVAKSFAAFLTGSSSMSSEAAHSVADTVNEVFLFRALRSSSRPADRSHPFGYGRTRYFWALVAAGSIFVTGALYSAFQGVSALRAEPEPLDHVIVNYLVLGVAFLLEGASLLRGLRQTRGEAREQELPYDEFLQTSDDPTATTVVFEDSAALVGLVLAAGGNIAHQLTGSPRWDGVASLAIAVLLGWVAFRLGRSDARLLTGVAADPRLTRAAVRLLGDQPEIEAVVDLLTLQLGTDQVLLCARLDLVDDLDGGQVERAMVRIGEQARAELRDVTEVFLEPVPRDDPGVRARARYGDDLAEAMVREAGD